MPDRDRGALYGPHCIVARLLACGTLRRGAPNGGKVPAPDPHDRVGMGARDPMGMVPPPGREGRPRQGCQTRLRRPRHWDPIRLHRPLLALLAPPLPLPPLPSACSLCSPCAPLPCVLCLLCLLC